jgi:hypothetical protein
MKVLFSLLTLAIALTSLQSLNAQMFSNPVRIPTSQDPISVFVVDLNGDGLPDLLYETSALNSTPGTIQTLLAQASGGYAQGPTTTLSLMHGDCRPVDVNGDGRQDLVCVDYLDECDSQIATLLGNGDGSFQQPIYSGLMHSNCLWAPFYPSFYTPADVNSDSHPDLFVGDPYNFEHFVLLGDGTGQFNISATVVPNYSGGAEMFAADLNGDGKTDLISSLGPAVWLGKGDGTFNPVTTYGGFWDCTLNDIEADLHPDAICIVPVAPDGQDTGTVELAILRGNADGSFNSTPIASQTFGNPQGGRAAIESPTAILDVNGDGIPDILAASSDGLSVLLGEGNLKFKPPVHYAVGNFAANGGITSQIVDLNHDGSKDIICTGAGGLYISYGTQNGTYDAPAAFPVANLLGGMTVGDFNGDGIPDIAATGDQSIELSLGNGDGTFRSPVPLPNGGISFAASTFAFNIAHGDFRGIGRQDILVIGSPGTYEYDSYVLLNNGDGTFQSPQQLTGSSVIWPYFELFAIADFNGDGRDDFLTTSPSFETVYIGLSNGDGTFNTVTTALPMEAGPSAAYPTFPALADFNRDGKPDLVYAQAANAYVLKGNGDGSFNTNALVLPIPPYQGQIVPKPMAVTIGDFDGDGNRDFAVLAEVGGYLPPPSPTTGPESAVYVFYGNGDGTFSSPVIAGGFNELYDTAYSADLRKNGRSDLILETTGSGVEFPGNSVGVVLTQSERLFGPETVYTAGMMGTSTFVADVNRDGYPDLLISNSSDYRTGYSTGSANSVTELLNLGPQTNPNLLQSSTALTASTLSFVAGTSVSFTATVSGISSSGYMPTGSVRFADQTGVESTVPLVPSGAGSAAATFTTNMIGFGADTMGATYSGDSMFATSSATVPLTATGLPDTISFAVTPNPVSVGSTVTVTVAVANPAGSSAAVPTGYIEFYDGSTIIGGPNALSNGTTTNNVLFSQPGQHTLSARYSGDLTHVSNSSATQVETVLITPNVLISTPPSITTAQVLSAAISVSGGTGSPIPTGSVTLTASTAMGGSGYTSSSATLSNGNVTIDIPAGALAPGTYWLAPTYTPDAASSSLYLSASTYGDYISVTVPPTTFIISGTAITVSPGAATGNTSTITVTPSGGFTGSVALSASITSGPMVAQYPPTLSFGSTSPVSITGTNAGTATLTVLTTAPSMRSSTLPVRRSVPWYASGSAALSCILLFGIPPMRRRWRAGLGMLALLLALVSGVLACGGNGNGSGIGGGTSPGTTGGTYTVTITGASGTTSATATVTLVVL